MSTSRQKKREDYSSLNTKLSNNYINELTKGNNFQYIITANQGDLHMDDKVSLAKYKFDISKKIIAKYSDKPEEMFFKRDYN